MNAPKSPVRKTLRTILDVRIAHAESFLVAHAGWTRARVREYLEAARQVWNEPQSVLQLEELVRYERAHTKTKKLKYALPIA